MKLKNNFRDKIVSQEEFISACQEWRRKKTEVVFTNGCFDLLHKGHVDYLYEASLKGQVLVIALNTDKSIRKIKGKTRPIQNQTARAELISALGFVDLVTFFDEDTPENLIRLSNPSILVKGADYKISEISGAEFVLSEGGKVETIEITSGYSTSQMIKKIKNATN